MLSLTMASWRQHRRRYVATFLAIFLGVGFCAATLSLTAAAKQGADEAAGSQGVNSLTNDIDVIGRLLQGFAVVSLCVAGLVIANTFRIVMAQRIKDIALLRCVGAERLQVFAMSIGEAALLGLGAAAVGTAAGIGVSALVVGVAAAASVDVQLSFVAPDLATLVLPFLGGLVMTVAAALSPVWRASRVPPLAAVGTTAEVGVRSRAGGRQLALGSLLGVLGAMLMGVAALSGRLAPGLAGGLLSFCGVLALAPLVVPASIRLAGRVRRLLPRRWRGGVPAELSVLNATRNPRRTAATAGALLVGVTLISMMSVGAASISATEARALDRVTPVDLTVSGGQVTSRLAETVRAMDGVSYVATAEGTRVRTSRGVVTVAALPPADADRVVRDAGLRAQLARTSLVTVPVSAQQQVPGDGTQPFRLRSGSGSVRLTPVFSSLTEGPMLVAPEVLQRLGGRDVAVALYVQLSDDADPQAVVARVLDTISEASPVSPLIVSGGYAKRSTYDRTIEVLLLVSTGLLGVAVLIALVGVGNTLSLSVLERTREHGLLRALGLTTGQLRLLLANEAVLIAGSAAVLGTALGIAYGWAGTLTLLHGATNHTPTLAVPVARLGLIIVVSVLAGLLASVLPARRAARLSPTEALVAD
jgi:putative ABC transport system permease protein